MDLSEKLIRVKPAGMEAAEWEVRLQLAALYRAFDWMGWTELIYNHITARVPGSDRHYLINPCTAFGTTRVRHPIGQSEPAGDIVDGSKYAINRAGFRSIVRSTARVRMRLHHSHAFHCRQRRCLQEGWTALRQLLQRDPPRPCRVPRLRRLDDGPLGATAPRREPRCEADPDPPQSWSACRRCRHSGRLYHVLDAAARLRNPGGHRRDGG